MAGKELYIEPILDTNLSVVPGLSDNIAEMTAQLNETTRILMNMMGNQGLELHQEAYAGAAFSALTITPDPWWLFHIKNLANIFFTSGNDWVIATSSAYPTHENYIMTKSDGSAEHTIRYFNWVENRDVPEKLKFVWWTGAGETPKTATLTIVVSCKDGATNTYTATGSQEDDIIINIDSDIVGKKLEEINVTLTVTITSDVQILFETPTFINGDVEERAAIEYVKKIGFNSANALTFVTHTDNGADDIITAPAMELSKAPAQKVVISLPDILGVGSWATMLINGNIEGVNLALVDLSTYDILAVLPAATSDISSVTQMSNIGLMVAMYDALQVINGIAQRYY